MNELVCDECGTPLIDGGIDWYCPSNAPHPKQEARVREMVRKNLPPNTEEVKRLQRIEAAAMEVLTGIQPDVTGMVNIVDGNYERAYKGLEALRAALEKP